MISEQNQRIVCWFSHGAASTVASKLAIEENNRSAIPKELLVVSIFIEDEHEDNERYRKDCEKFLGQKIHVIADEKYNASVDEVIKSIKYMSGVKGAPCTKRLKKQVRHDWQRVNDIHVFGMTSEEEDRIDDLYESEPGIELWAPLIEEGVTKKDCFQVIELAGIRLPEMYHLGFPNNNCKGCVKATSVGYWNLVRKFFPDVFETRSRQEYLTGATLCRMSANKFINEYPDHFALMYADSKEMKVKIKINSKGAIFVPLRYLPPDAGKHEPIYVPDCGFFCEKEGAN